VTPTWRLIKPLRKAIARGHPWVYDRAVDRGTARVAPGDPVTLVDRDGPVALAIADPGSPLCARVIGAPKAIPDDTWASACAAAAGRLRAGDRLLDGCDGIRWIHGENDGCPGLVVDGYAGVAVIAFDGDGPAAFWTPRLGAVLDGLRGAGAPIDHAWLRDPGRALVGAPPDDVAIRERDARFVVDFRRGQKTGFFLDQRANRFAIGAVARDRRVLNLFAYTGGFSIHAGLGGASHVTSVDVAAAAIAAADKNLAATGLARERHDLVVADAWRFLADAAAAHRTWDIVVSDPPSFAPSEQARPAALDAYRKLARMTLAVVAPGGLLAFASCSSHVTEADLLDVLAEIGGDRIRVVQVFGAASDHPTRPGFPEGRYLKFILCAADL
jgi:23S rRNA (cytosine1962-C5)-methyltransferase